MLRAVCFSSALLYASLYLNNGRVTYENIVQVDNLTKQQIFLRITERATQSYKSQKIAIKAEIRKDDEHPNYGKDQKTYKPLFQERMVHFNRDFDRNSFRFIHAALYCELSYKVNDAPGLKGKE